MTRHTHWRPHRRKVGLHIPAVALTALAVAACPPPIGPTDLGLACPDTVVAGQVFHEPVEAIALAGDGTRVPTVFELTMIAGPLGGVLLGTTVRDAPGGHAAFDDLTLSPAGDYTLRLTADDTQSADCDVTVVSADSQGEQRLLWIEKMDVLEESGHLWIHGIFEIDSEPTVVLGPDSLPVIDWSDSVIVAMIGSDPFGGDVTVLYGVWSSNTVPLTGWKGSFTYQILWDLEDWTGALTQVVQCDLHFRADVHPPRPAPEAAIEHRMAPIWGAAPASICTFEMSGTETDEDDFVTLSGSGEASFTFLARVSTDSRVVEMMLWPSAVGTATAPEGSSPAGLVVDPQTLMGVDDCQFDIPLGPSIEDVPMFPLPMDAASSGGLSVLAHSRSNPAVCGESEISAAFGWDAIPAISPYTGG